MKNETIHNSIRSGIRVVCATVLLTVMSIGAPAHAARLHQMIDVRGFRENPLLGYGLVVGLQGTGDLINSQATRSSVAQLMKNLGIFVTPNDIRARNVAMVLVTGKLPAHSRSGARLDVTVSSMGTARSLQGGTLIATPMKGADMKTYALAQGAITVGGFSFEGITGTAAFRNHTNVGRIPSGATVEKDAPVVMPVEKLELQLRDPSFTTASRIVDAINKDAGEDIAVALDGATVSVTIKADWKNKVAALIAKVSSLEAEPDAPARVIIDERTGTVVIGATVTLSPAAVAFGTLNVRVSERQAVSQPGPLAQGDTARIQETTVDVQERNGELTTLAAAATVGDVANALNALKAKPRDLIPILHALKAAGALQAEIQVM
ncbi:MAG: flagellar basal body P-ring protein FlgI [Deltaproteobacteria bacterium]|nr:flagellar basal body P-ring protein FlgI [Deltaproteobacteria bacterium]